MLKEKWLKFLEITIQKTEMSIWEQRMVENTNNGTSSMSRTCQELLVREISILTSVLSSSLISILSLRYLQEDI
jgi:hypothetical protein